jgi:DNA-binding IclR family transcriptional regulator
MTLVTDHDLEELPAELSGPVYSSLSALRAVEVMAFRPVSTTELSQVLSCHVRTARRILDRLVDAGWAQRVGYGRPRFGLTVRAAALGAVVLSRAPYTHAAGAVALELAERADRPVFIVVPCYDELLCIAASDDAPARRGDLLAVSGSAAALVLRAAAEAEDEVATVRQNGFARVNDHVALPVRFEMTRTVGAISIAGVGTEERAIVELALLIAAQSGLCPP